ncbi:hypothetical protein JR316_0011507 [Psilocybe cubensis]|uniref:Peptidase C14 caspase domain-containing protein n=2 Tax=Psilocybe cubensis TaxID=181762 RepID=A0A8H7XWW2_PSICU|nr:hypothetical protein JR316_0011507 [Psilocybe cubensis]KAH9475945.1 hypothetical protein JR316_0011507 [Psilocybe cubensis]
MAKPPPLVVRLIGIGKYEYYPFLDAKGDTNADDLYNFLNKEYKDGRECDIKVVKDATKEAILAELRSLREPVDRTKGIVVFFSSYGGSTGEGTSIICPTDIARTEKSKGITDKELTQLFDSIAKFRGKNITFFLDAPSLAFDWGWPTSEGWAPPLA